ncbi:MAG: 2-oxo acid dehydrogenase subunit E2 [Micrococcales bacterium]|nr:2-oxo acid dehydrogenase subunit E2 [Micrococcales bacterium]
MGEFTMPSLGADMDEGTLLEWLVKPGDAVHKGDVIAVVDTAKSAIDVEVFEDGVVAQLLVEPGTVVPVGTPMARIESAGGTAPVVPPVVADVPAEPVTALAPPIRHLLHQYGLDPADVHGTGKNGQITRKDVLAAAGESSAGGPAPIVPETPLPATPAPAPSSRPRVTPRARRLARQRGIDVAALTATNDIVTGAAVESAPKRAPVDRTAAMRAATAELMARAAREIPHYYVVSTIDMTGALDWLRERNAAVKPRDRVLPAVLFLRAAVVSATKVPDLNGHWDDHFHPAPGVDLGVAVATRSGGLVTPRIVGAQDLDLTALMGQLSDLVKRAKAGRLKASELQPGSITVSSLADGGPDALYGVIYPPQVALLGIGSVAPRPWVVDGEAVVRSTATVTLAADHRATDGRTGARFLDEFAHAVTHPEEL